MTEKQLPEGRRTDRRSYLKKLALGTLGIGALLSLKDVPKANADLTGTGATNQIAYFSGADTISGSNNLRWFETNRNFIAGYSGNTVTADVVGATISGGGASGDENTVGDHYGTVGGGSKNRVGDGIGPVWDRAYGTVGGGYNNAASGNSASVGGGASNTASGQNATVGGGADNTASNFYATVGGGQWNTASGQDAAVAGGQSNTAAGDYSFAAGRGAKINAAHDGSFLFADQSNIDFNSAAANEFAVRCCVE